MILELLYPRKCLLCRRLLVGAEIDLCHDCRRNAPEFTKGKFKISFVARWTAVWYYKDDVRNSLLRYKFQNRIHYGRIYGKLIAMRLLREGFDDFEVLTWVPVSFRRRWVRGFDQVEQIARAAARELGCKAVPTLKKIRHTPPQSSCKNTEGRKANVLGAYRVKDRSRIAGKRVLLLDDIITSGATLSECAKTLLIAGAKEVTCAAVAAASDNKKTM